jgi:hypothetical protein
MTAMRQQEMAELARDDVSFCDASGKHSVLSYLPLLYKFIEQGRRVWWIPLFCLY